MKHWEKIKLYRQKFETNKIDEKAFIKLLKEELNSFSNEHIFSKESDLLTKIDKLATYCYELEQQNRALRTMNHKIEQLIISKINTAT